MKVFIGICNSQDSVPSRFFWSLLAVENKYETKIGRGDHPWDVVRNNQLIKQFLDSDADIFVKMDVDQEYPKNYISSMVPLVSQYKAIGPIIHDRWEHNKFLPLSFAEVNYPKFKPHPIEPNTGVIEVPFPHTNLFYSREVLEKVDAPWYEATLRSDGLERSNHVDFDFLNKIKEVGYPIYINTDITVKHLAAIGIDNGVYTKWNN